MTKQIGELESQVENYYNSSTISDQIRTYLELELKEKISKTNLVNSFTITTSPESYDVELSYKVYDKDKEHGDLSTIKSKYQILGSYDKNTTLFQWAHAVNILDKNLKIISNNLKASSKLLKDKISQFKDDQEYIEKMLYYTSNNIFFIDQKNIFDLLKYSMYVNKAKGVLIINNSNYQTYIILTEIIGY